MTSGSLYEKKGKVASRDHAALNALRLVDAIDMQRMVYRPHPFEPDQVGDVTELHLRRDVPEDAHVFRALTKRDQLFLDAAVVEAAAVTGLRLFPAEGWDGDEL